MCERYAGVERMILRPKPGCNMCGCKLQRGVQLEVKQKKLEEAPTGDGGGSEYCRGAGPPELHTAYLELSTYVPTLSAWKVRIESKYSDTLFWWVSTNYD
jgi:hypothetical protein